MLGSFDLQSGPTLSQKLANMNWGLIILVSLVAFIGIAALYSAGNGNMDPWASRQTFRFVFCLAAMIIVALIDQRFWYNMSYLIYAAGFVMLVFVEFVGQMGMGAQRWINLGFIQIQPSELMKLALVMALARYFNGARSEDLRRLTFLIPPALLILAPVGLVLLQPNLGTAVMLVVDGAALFFLGGAPIWLFIVGIAAGLAAIPLVWHFYMHDYQKQRVLTFLDPEADPLGSGYHIMQSKIALGSGGIEGKGFLNGSQSHLNFLPEKQTDFIFTLWAEEWGLTGGLVLLGLLLLIFIYCGWISFRCRHVYGRLLAFGLMVNFSLYVFINIAMVMGLIPVVGIPLPLVSYGGTSMLAAMIGFGLIISANIHRDSKLPRN
ncbi:rod shape-determining protein RodA [Micavibrio aeruginosavorus]|uniref:rod shape-determining protein RodA n=1 Tax=Micavibrio aeruginosavorus TaxID=349221 RepID=UPI003F4AECA0